MSSVPSTFPADEKRQGSPFEPDTIWKQDLKRRIDGRLEGMIQEAKALHEQRLRRTSGKRALKLEAEFQQILDVVYKMRDATYQRELDLERDRREREWSDGTLKRVGEEQNLLDMILNSGEVSPSADTFSQCQYRTPSRSFTVNEEMMSSDSGSDGKSAAWSQRIKNTGKRRERSKFLHVSPLIPSAKDYTHIIPISLQCQSNRPPDSSRSCDTYTGYEIWIPSAFLQVTSPDTPSEDPGSVHNKGAPRVDEGLYGVSSSSSSISSSPPLSRRPPTPPFHTKPVLCRASPMQHNRDEQNNTVTSSNPSLVSSSPAKACPQSRNLSSSVVSMSVPAAVPTSATAPMYITRTISRSEASRPLDDLHSPFPSSLGSQPARTRSSPSEDGSLCHYNPPPSESSHWIEVNSSNPSWPDQPALLGPEKVQAWRLWSLSLSPHTPALEHQLSSDSDSQSEDESGLERESDYDEETSVSDIFYFEEFPVVERQKNVVEVCELKQEVGGFVGMAEATSGDESGWSQRQPTGKSDLHDEHKRFPHRVVIEEEHGAQNPEREHGVQHRQDQHIPSKSVDNLASHKKEREIQLKIDCEKGVQRFPVKEDDASTPVARPREAVYREELEVECVVTKQGQDIKDHYSSDTGGELSKRLRVVEGLVRERMGERLLSEECETKQTLSSPADVEVTQNLNRLRKEAAAWKTKALERLEEKKETSTETITGLEFLHQDQVKIYPKDTEQRQNEGFGTINQNEESKEDNFWRAGDLVRLEEESQNSDGCYPDKQETSNTSEQVPIFSEEVDGNRLRGVDVVLNQMQFILNNKSEYQKFLTQRGELAQSLLDLLQTLYDCPIVDTRLRAKIFTAMIRLSKKSSLYPSCLAMKDVQKIGDYPITAGGFGEIWRCSIGGQIGCLKMVKVYGESDIQILLKEFLKEAILWRQLDHPNVLPFLGLYFLNDHKQRLCLISPWMENGNVKQYLNKPSDKPVDRVVLAYDVANGLAYLHKKKVIHGDLKGVNILVTVSGRALVCDFGLSRVADSEALRWTSLSTGNRGGGTLRWLAPECLIDAKPVTYESDVYAFGCVCYEIFTGLIPFQEVSNDATIIFQLIKEKRPPRPQGNIQLTDAIWHVIEQCWDQTPSMRPVARDLPHVLESATGRSIGLANRWKDPLCSQLWQNVKHPHLCPSGSDIEKFLFG